MSETDSDNKKIKGIILFFVNLYPDLGQDIKVYMNIYKEMSKPLIDKLAQDGRYIPIFAPVHKEATRIEKIDFDAPFPRFTNNDEIVKSFSRPKKKTKKIFEEEEKEEEEETFFGFINLFINFQPEVKLNVQETINLVKEINLDNLEKINKDGRYTIVIVPTTKEGSRVQKIDFDSPFPRFVPKSTNKKLVLVQQKAQNFKQKTKNEKNDENNDYDIEDEDEENVEQDEDNL